MRPELKAALDADESTSFICGECDAIFDKRFEICPQCKSSGSIDKIEITPKLYDEDFGLFEEYEEDEWPEGDLPPGRLLPASKISHASSADGGFEVKIKSCASSFAGFDSLFGDKAIMGTLNLFLGECSSGKTSFFLKIAEGYSQNGHKTLYVSSEESSWQMSDRLQRMNINSPGLFLNSAGDLDFVIGEIDRLKPEVVILDSMSGFFKKNVDAMQSSNIQIRECCAALAKAARDKNITIFAVANNIDRSTMGEYKSMSHFFDSILSFEEIYGDLKLVRAVKARNSKRSAAAVFRCSHDGLASLPESEYESVFSGAIDRGAGESRIGVLNCFYTESGISMYNELQFISSEAPAGAPAWEICPGISRETVETVFMILEKYCGAVLRNKSVRAKLKNSAAVTSGDFELSLAAAALASYYDIPLSGRVLFIGAIDYSGRVKPADITSKQLNNLLVSGFNTIVSSNLKKENFENLYGEVDFYNIQNVKYLRDLLSRLSLTAEKTND
ncbi:MAG TPA: bifunctional adenosylcobinamide kinase/adenosylcobinamide-phosphate guanylyltransferase [Candidatus Wallbacteria bacterium]|nr:bifunctional adenosylcobinamide kinase/adenosylcobinamide-phosphate guanylyltransferase [Candidatus Wallbacteria bacterium]